MSRIMERTLGSIPSLLSASLLGGGRGGQGGHQGHALPPFSFQAFLTAFMRAQSRSEEIAVMHKELSQIKQQLEEPRTSVDQWFDIFPRVIFCAMMGYDVSFTHIYALKLAAQGKSQTRRVGYLAATLLLDSSCEITIMMMGTLQRDLHSSNILYNLMALSAAAQLVAAEHIPLMLPPVEKLLRHQQAMVREKAVYCMHAFFCRAPSLLQHTLPGLKAMLGDKDPGVLSAVVTLVTALVEHRREEFAALGMDLVNILQQVQAHKFPTAHDYHHVPLPWLQIQLLKTLAHLGSTDDHLAISLVPVLSQTLNSANTKEMISLAVVSECLLTVAALGKGDGSPPQPELSTGNEKDGETKSTESDEGSHVRVGAAQHGSTGAASDSRSGETLYRSGEENPMRMESNKLAKSGSVRKEALLVKFQPLLEQASMCVARFLNSGISNLRYIGIKSLTQLVSVTAELATHHQKAIVGCLDDPDLIVRRQTLALLRHMANPANVKVICAKMLEHLHSKDSVPSLYSYVVGMVCDISCRLAPDPAWFLQTLFPLLSLKMEADCLSSITDNMLQYFVKITQDPLWPEFPKQLFTAMVASVQDSDEEVTPTLQFALKVLRFVPLPVQETISGDGFLAACTKLLDCKKQTLEVKEQVVLCVQDLLLRSCLQQHAVLLWAKSSLDKCNHSTLRRYRQKLRELCSLASLDKDLTPLSALNPNKTMDFSLSFADSYAASLYKPGKSFFKTQPFVKGVGMEGHSVAIKSPISVDADSAPVTQDSHSLYSNTSACTGSSLEESLSLQSPSSNVQILPEVKRVWTKEGYVGDTQDGESAVTAGSVPDNSGATGEAQEGGESREELAQALFQGLSSNSSLTSSWFSSSQPTVTADYQSTPRMSASSLSPSSQNSMTANNSQDTLTASQSDLSVSSHNSMDTVVAAASDSQSFSVNMADQETNMSWSALLGQNSNSWKALHTTLKDSEVLDTSETSQPSSATVTSEPAVSELESGSSLSISADSLENIRDLSLQNSPAKQPAPAGPVGHSSPFPEASGLTEMQQNVYIQYLEAQMADFENSHAAVDFNDGGGNLYSGLEEDAANVSLYSGYEDLAPYVEECELEGEKNETPNPHSNSGRLERDVAS